MSLGIKESLELLAAVEVAGVKGVEIVKAEGLAAKAGKAVELAQKAEILVEGVKGLDLVDDEVKDLDQAELLQLGTAAFALVKKVVAAAKA